MASRTDRIASLQKATKEYVVEEKKRLENEVKVLEAVLSGRTGGMGIQKTNSKVVEAVAQNDLSSFLNGL